MSTIDVNPTLGGRAPRVPDGLRIYAIGDVHGRLDLLLRLEAMIDADARSAGGKRIVQVMLGDYIDRGPDSAGVIARLIQRGRERELITLRGNHEAYLLDARNTPSVMVPWCRYGGRQTLASYDFDLGDIDEAGLETRAPELAARFYGAMPPEHAAFYAATGLSWRSGDYLFAHAGIRPGVALESQSEQDLTWIRRDFLDSDADHGVIVVHGHTPGPEPVIRRNRIGIDTKAFASGVLTCLVVEGQRRRFLATG